MSPSCWKRAYLSESAARRCNRRAKFRIRAYHCPNCKKWHITNAEKSERY